MSRIIRVGLASLVILLANGCLHSTMDENWGKSHEAQVVWQTADQSAPATHEPTEGMDPETAQRVAERYYEGQEEQQQRRLPSVILGGDK